MSLSGWPEGGSRARARARGRIPGLKLPSFRPLAVVVGAALLLAFQPPSSEPRISLDVKEADVHDVLRLLAQVGGKNSSLGEMIGELSGLGVSVPGGFATTADAFCFNARIPTSVMCYIVERPSRIPAIIHSPAESPASRHCPSTDRAEGCPVSRRT